jgi:hypothetical protein
MKVPVKVPTNEETREAHTSKKNILLGKSAVTRKSYTNFVLD